MTANMTASLDEAAPLGAVASNAGVAPWFSATGRTLATPAGLLALVLVYAGIWLALTPYAGMSHDAQAYALQALARLQPEVYAQDLFLRYRSQEEFSAFTWLYAPLVGAIGLEQAASLLTLLCHAAWFTFVYLIVRRLCGTATAMLSLGLLVSIPGVYGGLRVFHVAEPFLTARLPAEVLSLAAIWLTLMRRPLATAVVLAIAMAMHPLMAFPAALLVALLWIGDRRSPLMLGAIVLGGVGLAIAGAYLLGQPTPIMDGRWLVMSRLRSAFLFLDQWQPADWNHTIQTFVTLGLSIAVIQSQAAKDLAKAALWVGLSGLVLAAFSSVVNLEVLLQGQSWRWVWPARVLAIALLPITVFSLWRNDQIGRASALLLVAGWTIMTPVSMRSVPVLMLGGLLIAASLIVWLLRERTPADSRKLLYRGAWAVAVFAMLGSLVTIWLVQHLQRADADSSNEPLIVILLSFITPAIAVAVGAWVLSMTRARLLSALAVAILGSVLVTTSLPDASDRWLGREYSDAAADEFADWRERIPPSAEVFWWENLRETWLLLRRPSYLTLSQGGGLVFSEPLADEVARRALVLEPLVDPNFWINLTAEDPDEPRRLTRSSLTAVCRDPELGFVISEMDLGTGAPAKHWPTAADTIYLYDCADVRDGQNDASPAA